MRSSNNALSGAEQPAGEAMKAMDMATVRGIATTTGTPVERLAIAMTLMAESVRIARRFLDRGQTSKAAAQLDDLLASWDEMRESANGKAR